MKIKAVTTNLVRLPLEEPLAGAPPFAGMLRDFVTLQIVTDDGIEGIGITTFGGKLVRSLKAAVEDLAALTVGEDPQRTELIIGKLRAAAAPCSTGIATLALSAIDMALWDIRGKAAGVSVSHLLGGKRDSVPAYASGALIRTNSLADVERAAAVLIEKGYTQVKSQMGGDGMSPAQEIARIRAIRKAVGPDVNLMVDINQRWGVQEAISIGQRIQDVGLGWIEDPTAPNDYQGLARIAGALGTPICAGEYVWGIEPFRQLFDHGSIDVAMIDLLRVGGITQWMKVAGMAEAFNLPVATHLLPEIHCQLLAAIPNALVLEYMPWTWRLFDDPPKPVNGVMKVPAAPGFGLTFASDLFGTYGVG